MHHDNPPAKDIWTSVYKNRRFIIIACLCFFGIVIFRHFTEVQTFKNAHEIYAKHCKDIACQEIDDIQMRRCLTLSRKSENYVRRGLLSRSKHPARYIDKSLLRKCFEQGPAALAIFPPKTPKPDLEQLRKEVEKIKKAH